MHALPNRFHWKVLAAFLGLLPAASGCGPRYPATITVKGLVTLDGQPVEGAAVMFYPESGRPAGGTTDAAGRFQLQTFQRPRDGALPGVHRVTVNKTRVSGVKANAEGLEEGIPAEELTVEFLVPERYANVETSGLTAEVKPGMGELKFELTSQAN